MNNANTKETSRNEENGSWFWRTIALCITVFIVTMVLLAAIDQPVYAASVKTEEYTIQASHEEIQAIIDRIDPDMDISIPSGLSKDDFVFVMQNYKYDYRGILRQNAEEIWELAQKYNIFEFFITGVFGEESQWGRYECAPYNVMGIKGANGKYRAYNSYAECFEEFAELISTKYIPEKSKYHTGGVLSEIAVVYCDEEWAETIANRMRMTTRPLQKK